MSTGDRVAVFTLVFFRRDASGEFIGMTKVRGISTVDATSDGMTVSPAKRDDFDTQGHVTRSVGFTATGTRVKVEAP